MRFFYVSEKKGALPKDEKRMEVFREVLVNYGLYDMGFSRPWFTWERGNLPTTNTKELLDRGVANDKWLTRFSSASIYHLPYSFSEKAYSDLKLGGLLRSLLKKKFKKYGL